ncbi:MAG: hypothetical protein PHY82_05110 [Lentisphaeria bacterium]|nr:hypothetical protein [Lentisphaeria bacterium]
MSSEYCKVCLQVSPNIMQAVKLEAARRSLSVEEMITRYLMTFLPENVYQALMEYDEQSDAES